MSGEHAADVRRGRLVALVQKLMDGDYDSDADLDRDMAELEASVPHAAPSDLIYYWHLELGREPTAAEVVDRALAYRPIEL